jgi:hypothetical protein
MGCLRRALPAEFGGRAAFVPEATDLALLALLHAMRPDAHAGLRWALDLAAMDRKSRLDGAALEARAAAWGFGAPVRAALERLRALLGIVPAGALAGGAPTETAEARMTAVLGRFGPQAAPPSCATSTGPSAAPAPRADSRWPRRRALPARVLPHAVGHARLPDTVGRCRAVGGPR